MKKIIIFCAVLVCTLNYAFAAMPSEITAKMAAEMKIGKTNDSIKSLQETLYELGYFLIEEEEPIFSGKFDNTLRQAIMEFQETNELKPTGEINQETYKLINELLEFISDQDTVDFESFEDDESANDIDKYSEEGLGFDNYKHDVVDTYKSPDIFSYYEGIPGISIIKDVVNNVFDTSKKEGSSGVFDIFKCFLDPICAFAK